MAFLVERSIYLPKYISFPSASPSELLSESLKYQAKASEESKKRKRLSLTQPIRTEQPSFTPNTPSPSRNRYSVESQSATDVLPLLSSTMPFSQPAHDFMFSRTLSPTDISILRSSWSRLIFLNLFHAVFSRDPPEQTMIAQYRQLLHTSVPFLPRQTPCLPLIIFQ